jgi:uncharacterized protein DUF4157
MSSKKQTHAILEASPTPRSAKSAPRGPLKSGRQQSQLTNLHRLAETRPGALTPKNVLQLQRTVGNRATARLLSQTLQRRAAPSAENATDLPDDLKAGIESLSGLALDDVNVHYNSDKPARVQALAYTQGTAIHIAPGEEEHLAHEAWHVVQQKQGRVRPTLQAKGVSINTDDGLEREADVMGAKALRLKPAGPRRSAGGGNGQVRQARAAGGIVQRVMTPEELRLNRQVQALKPQVNQLQRYIRAGNLGRQSLATLRPLSTAVTTSIRLRTRLGSLGSHQGHIDRITTEEGFKTAVDAEIRRQEAAASRAAANATIGAAGTTLPAGANWGGARG